jgi:hypothetical protein
VTFGELLDAYEAGRVTRIAAMPGLLAAASPIF